MSIVNKKMYHLINIIDLYTGASDFENVMGGSLF